MNSQRSNHHNHDDVLTEATDEREEVGVGGLPSEAQLCLLALDYLRDLRRAYEPKDLLAAEGLDAEYLSLAIYALSRTFRHPHQLSMGSLAGNDAWMDRAACNRLGQIVPAKDAHFSPSSTKLPPLEAINEEIMYGANPRDVEEVHSDVGASIASDENEHNPYAWHRYKDETVSNLHRFYALNGLSSERPLTLGEITAAGLAGLGARSRLDAEREMVQTPLFDQFVAAVRQKGFFRDPDTEEPRDDPEQEEERLRRAAEIYEDRYLKVVSKFRSKLEHKADATAAANGTGLLSGNLLALNAASRQSRRRERRTQVARSKQLDTRQHLRQQEVQQEEEKKVDPASTPVRVNTGQFIDSRSSVVTSLATKLAPSPRANQLDVKEAERLKLKGNQHMQQKDYQKAADYYTQALQLSPAGPHSHVYFSNRAAALLSLKRFDDAIQDSERSLALKPDYGKAHARLGLSHFLLGNYRQALEAYTVSLKYEPDNQSSKQYLEKAARRLAKKEGDEDATTSFSVVSEWDKAGTRSMVEDPEGRKRVVDQTEAERNKSKGNSFMASRDYQAALEAYSKALELCSDGPQSHVYYSNRAASLCYLERYEEAEQDSLESLKLQPEYGKAYARLGLSRFFMSDYRGAVEAYTAALKFDPDNAASKSYLAKAKARLKEAMDDPSISGASKLSMKSSRTIRSSSRTKREGADRRTPSRQRPPRDDSRERFKPGRDSTPQKGRRDSRGTRSDSDHGELKKIIKTSVSDPTMVEAMLRDRPSSDQSTASGLHEV